MFHVKIQNYPPIETNIDVFQVLQFLLGLNELGLFINFLNPANHRKLRSVALKQRVKSIQPGWGGSRFLDQVLVNASLTFI